ncbi:MAG: UvrD-helicase domain-containing protein [Candidatus Levybacteria bacterium]|nr:UvrD-helicase domain-containing protein [Candidatus Levybacteria bacterium]
MEDILKKLNSDQREAVIHTAGPAIILAGAGSGKTRVLVHKVLYLIHEKRVQPQNILMVTFSNKAAGEMKERIKSLLASTNNDTSNNPTVATFHSLCARILRKSGTAIGIPHNFVIYDKADQLDTIKDCYEKLELSIKDIRPKAALDAISSAKNQMISEEQYLKYAKGYIQERVAKIYPLYQNLLAERNALDFDDLLNKTITLFRDSPKTLEYYQELFHYVLVDEYQDTNISQYRLTKYLAGKHNNICIVGDFSQSIYSFRGADYKNLEKFKTDFPTAKVYKLSQNYRSTQIILDAAHAIISNNNSHPVLKLWTDNKQGEEISIYEAENEHKEAEYIVKMINNATKNNSDFSLSDVAVLYRMNAQSRTLEEVLLHFGIPYKLVGGVRFYDRREVKDVLSYLSYLSNQQDATALKRIQKLGKRRFSDFEFYRQEFNEANYSETKETLTIIDEVLKRSSYLERYDPEDSEDRTRLENIKELRSVAIEFPNLIQFLENVALVEQEYMPDGQKEIDDKNAITLMTMHAAKGLEFKMVFIVGLEEGVFPHAQSLFDFSDLEEERRLCYVGVTRAKEHLYLTYAKQRVIFGQRNAATPSRFIFELPTEVLEYNNVDTTLLNKEYW